MASHHDLEGTPQIDVMRMLLDHMCEGGADIVKLVVTPKTTEDVLRLLAVTSEFHSEIKKHRSLPCPWETGAVSRVSGETFGSCVTFASHGKKSAPGQFQLEEMQQTLAMLHEGCE